MGIMPQDFDPENKNAIRYWEIFGHGGQDYGSAGSAGYNPSYDFSVAMQQNSEFAMNCTLPFEQLMTASNYISCLTIKTT
eukprot:UN15207